MGASVGAFIAMIVFMLSRAWLEVVSGKLKGTEFILDKFLKSGGPTAIIGSDSLKADIVLPDPDIAPQHAILQGAGSHFNLKDISLNGTFINGQKVEHAPLRNRQKINMGNTEMRYYEKR
jgi:pSer/pThr/pTyr-binding forkhead associated (FHA) protein